MHPLPLLEDLERLRIQQKRRKNIEGGFEYLYLDLPIEDPNKEWESPGKEEPIIIDL